MEPLYPPLRLLGGSAPGGKPSKLAALAAARKKKEAEQKAGGQGKPVGAASLLDRLSTKAVHPVSSQPGPSSGHENEPLAPRAYPIRKRKSPSPPPPVAERRPTPSEPTLQQPLARPATNVRASPSIFAQAMCGGGARTLSNQTDTMRFRENIMPALYGAESNLANNNPFTGPSPDDIVMQAQAKGSTRLL